MVILKEIATKRCLQCKTPFHRSPAVRAAFALAPTRMILSSSTPQAAAAGLMPTMEMRSLAAATPRPSLVVAAQDAILTATVATTTTASSAATWSASKLSGLNWGGSTLLIPRQDIINYLKNADYWYYFEVWTNSKNLRTYFFDNRKPEQILCKYAKICNCIILQPTKHAWQKLHFTVGNVAWMLWHDEKKGDSNK